MTAPSLIVGDSVREICGACFGQNPDCANCDGGYVYRDVYDEQRSGEMRDPVGCVHGDPPCWSCRAFWKLMDERKAALTRIAALARAVEDPTNSEPLRQLLAAIKEAAR